MKMLRALAKKPSERGQSLTELAVSMMLLMILLAGVIDIGRITFNHIALRDGTEEGAVYGSINPNHCTQIEEHVRSSLFDPDGATVTIKIYDDAGNAYSCLAVASNKAIACEGHVIEVIAAYPNFPLSMPFIGTVIGSQTINLEVKIKNTIIRPACVVSP